MYGQIADALTQSIVAGMDPMNGLVRQMAGQQFAQADLALDQAKLDMVETIAGKLAKAKESNADEAVIGTYQRLLSKYSS